jgi:dipeptidyl aminopeptidase/acylaminoacyl peptidase
MRRLFISFSILSIFVSVLALPSFSQARHPFTFEDMMALKRVGEPVPSPDGKWVVFSAVDVDLEKNTKTPHIWIVPTAGGESREIIKDQDADRPRWAPDGKHFAFLSTKEGGSQIWIADFDGSAGTVTGTHRLTVVATEAGGELWSPDGKSILFTSDVYPECDGAPAAEADCNAKKLEEHAKSPVKALVFDRLLYRHWNAYKEGKRSHIFVVPADACVGTAAPGCPAGAARDLTPGDFDAPVFSLGGQDNYAFSPDGQEICYTSNHDKVEATSTNNDLWIVLLNGGPAKNITADNPASDSTPLYSPDGKYIAYRAQKRPGYESDRFRLMLYDRKAAQKAEIQNCLVGSKNCPEIEVTTNLSENFDRWVGTFTWAADSKAIYLTTEEQGKSPIHRVFVGSPNVIWKLADGFNDDLSTSSDGKTLTFTRMSLEAPNEIYTVDMGSGKVAERLYSMQQDPHTPDGRVVEDPRVAAQLTHFNSPVLSQVAMSPIESFWFSGANGDKVQGFLVKPPNFDASKKYPLKFLVHGGPQGAWGDDWSYRWNPELFAANGYVVIMINFHGSTGYGQKFIDAINGDWGGAPFEDLMKGLDYAEKTYPFIDKDRECALGASYGGYAINWILGHTNRFKCLVSHDGMFNAESAWGTTEELWFNEWEFKGTPWTNREMYRKWSPHLSATSFKTPTLVIHGQRDYRLDVSEGFQLFTTLQRLNVPSKMLYFPDEGHWVLKPQNSRFWYQTVNDWVDQWVKK